MQLDRWFLVLVLCLLPAMQVRAADVSELAPTANTVALTGATFHALKSTPDGRPALVVGKRDAQGAESLQYWEREASGQWRAETVPEANGYFGRSAGAYGEYGALWAGLFFTPSGTPLVLMNNGELFSRSGGAWERLVVAGNSPDLSGRDGMAAMGPDGSLHTLSAGLFGGVMTYGHLPSPGTAWQSTPLTVSASTGYYNFAFEPRFMSMVVDANNKVHATYVPEFKQTPVDGGTKAYSELWYLTNKNGSWETSKIFAPPAGGYGDAGYGSSIALRPDGKPAVASIYISRAPTGSSSSETLYLHELTDAGTWTSGKVSSSPDGYLAGDGAQGTGFAPHLLYDPLGRPHIAFTDFASQHFSGGQDEFGGNLRHAWRDGSTWRFTSVYRQADPIRNQLFWPNMALVGGKVAVLGEVAKDTLDSGNVITGRAVGLVYREFLPAGLSATTLTLAQSGTGRGLVTSAPAGLACSGNCSGSFLAGTSVTLTATADPGCSFSGWTGCDATAGNVCTVTAASARTVTVSFADVAPPVITLTSVPPATTNKASGTVSFSANEPATFKCQLDNGASSACTSPYAFSGLAFGPHTLTVVANDGTNPDSSTATHTWSVLPLLVSESFDAVVPPAVPAGWTAPGPYAYAKWTTNAGARLPSGTAAQDGPNLIYFNSSYVSSGATAALASPAFSLAGVTGARLKFWMYRDSRYSYGDDRVDLYLNATPDLLGTPTLLGTVHRLTAREPSVPSSGWYEYGFELPGSSTTNHIVFNGISGGGSDINIDNIKVVYPAPQTLTVNLAGSGGGTVTSTSGVVPQLSCASPKTSCTATVDYGASVTLSATQSVGALFIGWSGACSGATCTFSMEGNKTAVAGFDLLKYLKNERSGAFYGTVTAALADAGTGDRVRALGGDMVDAGFVFARAGVELLLKGGYAALGDATAAGYTAVDGPVVITGGTLRMNRVKVK